MDNVRRLVLDVMKPHQPSIIELTQRVSSIKGIDGVNTVLMEIDQETENIKITMQGPDIPYKKVKKILEELGASLHSIDAVATGSKIVEEVSTPQD